MLFLRTEATPPSTPRRREAAPFGFLLPALLLAGGYLAATLVWAVAGPALPGGRWLAVHLFTLGVLSTLVLALTHHFAQTLLHVPGRAGQPARLALLQAGTLLVLVGLPTASTVVTALGATLALAAVAWLWQELRTLRQRSLTERFAYVVRGYERAALAFAVGAALGGLMGAAVLGGPWYLAAREAHLQATVLGWGGITLLATVVFFGPTIMRAQIVRGADRRAVPALRVAAATLLVATLALLATGFGDPWATPSRLLAGLALAGYATGATIVAVDVLRAGRNAKPTVASWMLRAASAWLVATVWANAVTVGLDEPALLRAVGLAGLLAVLGQAIVASLSYLAPMALGRGPAARTAIRARLEALAVPRAAAYNLGAVLAVGATVAGSLGAPAATALATGWALVAAAVVLQAALTLSAALATRQGGDAPT